MGKAQLLAGPSVLPGVELCLLQHNPSVMSAERIVHQEYKKSNITLSRSVYAHP